MLVVAELLVPLIAERAPGGPTTWHPYHIAERYGLFFVWLLHIRPHQQGSLVVAYPAVAVLVLLAPLSPEPVYTIAGLLVVLVAITVAVGRRVPDRIGSAG